MSAGNATPPGYMRHLVDRAAMLMHAHWPSVQVAFTWRTQDGQERPFVARLDWPLELQAPRLRVFDGRLGDFVCQSLPGDWFTLDPELFVVVPPGADEIDGAVQMSAPAEPIDHSRHAA